MSHREHCSCKLSPLQPRNEPISASCAPACVLSLQHEAYACTRRGLFPLYVTATCPLVSADLKVGGVSSLWIFWCVWMWTDSSGCVVASLQSHREEFVSVSRLVSWFRARFSFPSRFREGKRHRALSIQLKIPALLKRARMVRKFPWKVYGNRKIVKFPKYEPFKQKI